MKTRTEKSRQKTREIIDDYGTSPKRMLMDLLREAGIDLPRPQKMTGREVTAKLWEMIHGLLGHSIVLCNTDHLSDRELYTLLWKETLRKEFVRAPRYPLHIDMTKTGVDDGMPVYLKYYASEPQRQMYSQVYPEFKMPAHVDPRPRRDHLIPGDLPAVFSDATPISE